MPASAIERLQRVMELEERQGWRNRAVIGGLQAMGERWSDDAASEDVAEQTVKTVVALMGVYEELDQDQRPQLCACILAVLEGDESGVSTWLKQESDDRDRSDQPADISPDDEYDDGEDGDDGHDLVDIGPPEPTHVARRRVRRQQRESGSTKVDPHDLQSSPQSLNGVGPARAEQLARMGINQVVDLLWHLPARYDDFSQLKTIDKLVPGEQVTVVANLWEVRRRKIRHNREIVQGILADGTGTLHATWWNKYVDRQLETGKPMRFSGKVGLYLGQKTLDNPAFEDVDEECIATGSLSPIYRLTEGISNPWLRSLIRDVVDDYARFLSDPMPDEVRHRYKLADLTTSLTQAHMPDDREQLDAALQRLAFEEFFYLQLGVLERRRTLHSDAAPAMNGAADALARFHDVLPFAFTGAQARAVDEILADMGREIPMTRLVQGDVGSGKTAVAAAAVYLAAMNGFQSALLAPTQILAEQHHRGISDLLSGLTKADGTPVTSTLLTGRVTGAARDEVLEGLRNGAVDVVIGTTALIQEQVEFANLGFAVVDEQHRFGVEQRGALRTRATTQPHLLVMSATPIPRSLALTLYGELDLSIIDEMPPGRTPIKTKLFRPAERERLYGFMRRQAQEGRQAYIIYPLVEESDKLDAGAAVEAHAQLQEEVFPDLNVALLHGRMTGSEKDQVMRAFAGGEYQILVSTTVIEVGIDVPNATLIMVEDADRFGLAQLHQLRGRVGRGQHQSYCALVSKAEGADAEERLRALEATNSGFELAEIDLELRGPGDFLGTRQSGLPDLRIAALGDLDTLVQAREAAQSLFESDPNLDGYPDLRRQVQRFWRGHGDVN